MTGADDFIPAGQPPSESDWSSEPWDLDMKWAHATLAGLDPAGFGLLLERSCPLSVGENVFACPSKVFPYYLQLHLGYLASSDSDGDADSASALPDRVIWRAKYFPDDIRPNWPLVRLVLERIAAEHDRFDAPREIYGDLAGKCIASIREVERILGGERRLGSDR